MSETNDTDATLNIAGRPSAAAEDPVVFVGACVAVEPAVPDDVVEGALPADPEGEFAPVPAWCPDVQAAAIRQAASTQVDLIHARRATDLVCPAPAAPYE